MTDPDSTTTAGPAPLAQESEGELAPDDPRALFADAVMVTAESLRQLRPEQWHLPTPCDGVDVGQLAEHLVMVLRRVACAGRGEPTTRWPIDAADVAAGGWAEAFTEAGHDVQAAWPDPVLDRPTELPWGVFSGREVLGVYTNELAVHTWDLSQATGRSVRWDPAVLEAAMLAIHEQLPTAERAPMWNAIKEQLPPEVPWEDPFADAVDVPADAPLIDRLVAWNGRTP